MLYWPIGRYKILKRERFCFDTVHDNEILQTIALDDLLLDKEKKIED